jgi:hypothetical protein
MKLTKNKRNTLQEKSRREGGWRWNREEEERKVEKEDKEVEDQEEGQANLT